MPEEQQQQPVTPDPNASLDVYRAQREGKTATPAAGERTEEQPAGQELREEGSEHQDPEERPQGGDPNAGERRRRGQGGFQKKIAKQQETIDRLKAQLDAATAGVEPGDEDGDFDEAEEVEDEEAQEQEEHEERAPARREQQRQQEPPAGPKFTKPKPKLEDFNSIEEFTDAITDWKLEKRDFEQTAETQRAEADRQVQQLVDTWDSRVTEAKRTLTDYDEVLAAVDGIKLPLDKARTLMETESGAEVAYELAKDPKEFKRIAALPLVAFAREIGKIESRIEGKRPPAGGGSAPQEQETRVSRAPAPTRSVRTAGAATSAGTLDVSKMSSADYRKARESGKLK